MLNIGPQELLIVLIIALIVVGPQRLPELSRQIGKGLREFRKVQDEVKGIAKLDLDDTKTTPRGTARSTTPTAPAVHRTPRPAPSAEPAPTSAATPPASDGPDAAGSSPADTAG